jgi:hypothetical protein
MVPGIVLQYIQCIRLHPTTGLLSSILGCAGIWRRRSWPCGTPEVALPGLISRKYSSQCSPMFVVRNIATTISEPLTQSKRILRVSPRATYSYLTARNWKPTDCNLPRHLSLSKLRRITFIRSRGLQSHKRSRGGYLPLVTLYSYWFLFL